MQLCSPTDKFNTRPTQRPRCFILAYLPRWWSKGSKRKSPVRWVAAHVKPRLLSRGHASLCGEPCFVTRALTTCDSARRDSRLVACVKSFAFIGLVQDLLSVYRLRCCNSVVTIPAEVPLTSSASQNCDQRAVTSPSMIVRKTSEYARAVAKLQEKESSSVRQESEFLMIVRHNC